jgi:LEA14-like dessication related protein
MHVNFSKSSRSKRKIAFSIFIVAILIINVVTCALIFLDIRVIKSPEVTIELDLVEINSNEAIIQTTLSIKNPNQFGLIIKDLEIVTKTDADDEILEMKIAGGEISSNENKTYTSNDAVIFKGEIPKSLNVNITGIVGFQFLGIIKKTIPLEMKFITSFGDIVDSIDIPVFSIKGDFGDITNDGISFTADIDIDNPNTFDLYIDDIFITMITENGDLLEDLEIMGDLIGAKSAITLHGNGIIPIVTLNAETLFINLNTSIGVIFAGITKFIDFSTVVEITVPHIEDIFNPDLPTIAFIDADMKLTRNGFLSWGFTSYMTLEIRNPNKIGLLAKDVVFSIFRVDDGEQQLIGDCTVNETTVEAENSTLIPAQIYLPMNSLFKGQRIIIPELPDGLLVVVETNITIPGLDETVWIGVSGYQDMHLFT